jgi:hypothetical protein
MGFLRRLISGDAHRDAPPPPEAQPADPAAVDADERAYELELLRGEQARLGDLAQRQLRWAKDAWQPPAQGGDRRADDRDRSG